VLPPASLIQRRDTHRLIPSKYGGQQPLEELADTAKQFEDLAALSNVTDERPLAEAGLLLAISPYELVSGVPHAKSLMPPSPTRILWAAVSITQIAAPGIRLFN